MANRKSSNNKIQHITLPESCATKVFLSKSEALRTDKNNEENPLIISLKHPQTNETSYFLLSQDNKSVYEVLTFSEDKRSWIIDDKLLPSGKMYISTPVDPLFLVLPYLKKAPHCSPLDDIVKDDDFPDIRRVLNCLSSKNMEKIADMRGDPSLNAFIYNEEKTLSWLGKKTEKVAHVIHHKGMHVGTGMAVSANFKTEKSLDSESYLKYGYGIVADYLSDDLAEKLFHHLKLPIENDIKSKRKEFTSPKTTEEKEAKKVKIEEISPVLKDKPVKISAKEKARAKAALGTKSISSFFKKV